MEIPPVDTKMININSLSLSSYINETVLCGEKGFTVWDAETNNFGHCFQDLVLTLPAQVRLLSTKLSKTFSDS